MEIRCTIDARDVPIAAIGVLPMNFGQARLWANRPHARYSLRLARAVVINLVAAHYGDMKDDASHHPDVDDSLERRLSLLDWPPLEQLGHDAPDEFLELLRMFGYDVLLAIESVHSDTSCDYTLASIEEIATRGEHVEFAGIAVPRNAK